MNLTEDSKEILLYSDYLNEILLCIDVCAAMVEEKNSHNFRTSYPEIFEVFFSSLVTKIIINSASLFSDKAEMGKKGQQSENLSLQNYLSKNKDNMSKRTLEILSKIEAQLSVMNLTKYRNKLVAHKSKIETIMESPYSEHEGHSFNRLISINSLRQLALLGVEFFNSSFTDRSINPDGRKYPDNYNFINYQSLRAPYSMESFLLEFESSKFI